MYIDKRAEFCSAVSVAGAAGTALIGSQYDLGITTAGIDVDDLYLVIQVSTAIVTGGSAGKLEFQLCSDSTAAIDVSDRYGTCTIHYQSAVHLTDDVPTIPVGTILACVEIPKGSGVTPAYERYLGIRTVITTTTITAGAVNAFLTNTPHAWRAMPQAVN